MIRVEVDNEADVTRMVAAFTVLPVLKDSDYEVFLLPDVSGRDRRGRLRAWRRGGVRAATNPTDWAAEEADTLSAEHGGEVPSGKLEKR